MKHLKHLWPVVGLILLLPAGASAAAPSSQIQFQSFNGVYYLSRDSRGLSMLTSEEAISAIFPEGSNYSGITRQIPENYQGHSVDVQIVSVTDAGGQDVPYKTSRQGSNLVVTTGDPSITLYGSQVFHITYHTTGVVNLSQRTDQFTLDVNGRGWSQPFASVSATLYIANSFQAQLTGKPSCYLALNNLINNNCSVSSRQTGQGRQLQAAAHNLAANQSLVLKMSFAPATFTNQHKAWQKAALIWAAIGLAGLIILGFIIEHFWPEKSH